MVQLAFTSPLTSTSFLSRTSGLTNKQVCSASRSRRVTLMQEKTPAGDGGAKPPAAKAEEKAPPTKAVKLPVQAEETAQPAKAVKLPVQSESEPTDKEPAKRGLDLLRRDFLKSAPERFGVGRQDLNNFTVKPVAGEPGYKPESYETVRVSELGISPFPDDKNFVSNVGGVDAVKKAAIDAKQGKSAKAIKKEVMKIVTQDERVEKEVVYDIPDYLKPLPEDTPRKGMTWKNY